MNAPPSSGPTTDDMTKTKPKEAIKAARWSTRVTTAMTARIDTNIPEAPGDKYQQEFKKWDRNQLTYTLDSTPAYQCVHILGHTANKTTELKKENCTKEHPFRLEDREHLSDEKNKTTLGH